MSRTNITELNLTEIELVTGGAINGDEYPLYIQPPFIEWPEPGKPSINPGIPFPPVF